MSCNASLPVIWISSLAALLLSLLCLTPSLSMPLYFSYQTHTVYTRSQWTLVFFSVCLLWTWAPRIGCWPIGFLLHVCTHIKKHTSCSQTVWAQKKLPLKSTHQHTHALMHAWRHRYTHKHTHTHPQTHSFWVIGRAGVTCLFHQLIYALLEIVLCMGHLLRGS